jgi:hypothetical protein
MPQHPPQPARTKPRHLQVHRIDPAHDREIESGDRPEHVVDRASGDPQRRGLSSHRQAVRLVDHRLAPSRPASPSACSKKSFSSADSPIFAWSVFTSAGGAVAWPPGAKRLAARASNWSFHAVICAG